MEILIKTNNKKDLRIVYVLFGILILLDLSFLVWYGINAYVTTRPIEIGGSIECNSGNIGIDYQTHFNQTYPYENIPTTLDLKGIDNLNCKATFTSKTHASDAIQIIKAIILSQKD